MIAGSCLMLFTSLRPTSLMVQLRTMDDPELPHYESREKAVEQAMNHIKRAKNL